MSGFEVYLWTTLNAVETMFGFGVVIFALAWLVLLVLSSLTGETWCDSGSSDDEIQNWESRRPGLRRWAKRSMFCFIACLLCLVFVPDKEQAATIYVLPKIANSEMVKRVPDDLDDVYRAGVESIKKSLGVDNEIVKIKKELEALKGEK